VWKELARVLVCLPQFVHAATHKVGDDVPLGAVELGDQGACCSRSGVKCCL
jgi:hypothetical protein